MSFLPGEKEHIEAAARGNVFGGLPTAINMPFIPPGMQVPTDEHHSFDLPEGQLNSHRIGTNAPQETVLTVEGTHPPLL